MRAFYEYDARYAEPVRQGAVFSPFRPLSDRERECAEMCGPQPILCINCGRCMLHGEDCLGKREELKHLIDKTQQTMEKIDEKDRKARALLSYYGQLLAFDTTRDLSKIEILDFMRYMNEVLGDLK